MMCNMTDRRVKAGYLRLLGSQPSSLLSDQLAMTQCFVVRDRPLRLAVAEGEATAEGCGTRMCCHAVCRTTGRGTCSSARYSS